MRKLRLDLESLSVESFDAAPAERAARGTVHGNQIRPFSKDPGCLPFSPNCALSDDDPTCQISCGQAGICTYVDP